MSVSYHDLESLARNTEASKPNVLARGLNSKKQVGCPWKGEYTMKALLGILLAGSTPFVIFALLQTQIGRIALVVLVFGGLILTVIMNLVSAARICVEQGESLGKVFGKSGVVE
jgi:hypothetical protein